VIDLGVLQEPARLDALRRLALANLEPEEPFDRLTRLAAFICSAPTALLTFVDHRTEHFKSAQGLPPALADLRRISLDYSICQYAVAAGGPLVVSDARDHPLLATHPAVNELGVVAYAGVPLITSTGQCLGTIAVLDWAPRDWGDDQVAMLRDLAATAVTELELRRELTDRSRMENALRESETRYRSLIDQTSDIITVIDESAVVRYGSPSVETVLGYDPDDLVGRRAVDLVHPDDVEPLLEAHRSALLDPTEAQRGVEFRCRHRDGSWRVLEALGSVMQYRSAGPQAVLTLRDVTEHRKAETALRDSEERLRLTLDAGKCGIWDWDIATDRLTWSDRVYELHGVTPETFGGRLEDFMSLIHPADRARVSEAVRQALENRADYGIEFRVIRPGTGQTRWVWTNGRVLFGEDGAPRRMLGATLDSTERRQAEEALRGSHEQLRQLAHRLDEVREEELTRVSREIHDELGHALTVLRLDLGWLAPRVRRNREPVPGKVAGMLSVVDDTIDNVRRIAARLRPPVLEDFGLAAAIDALLARFVRQTGIAVELQADSVEVPPAAGRALYRIVQEALTNVARHAQASRVHVTLHAKPDLLVLKITDDGVGIPPGMIGNSNSLGLVGMRERAVALRASFEVMGRPEGGTTIRVAMRRPRPRSEGRA
jgi:two-component system, NarL family, sensor histidine kinase UhpB